jgi:hypothetical protein
MINYWLKIELMSDTLFGRGDGLAGVVNAEVQHDAYGLPYLGGKALKGILGATCAEILFGLQQANRAGDWSSYAADLFGKPGSTQDDMGVMHVGEARLPSDLQAAIAQDIASSSNSLEPIDVLEALTTLRRQTAMDAASGAPKKETLRAIRVIRRELTFTARLSFYEPPTEKHLALLAAIVKAFRRVGTQRNRGLGLIKADLFDTEPLTPDVLSQTDTLFQQFEEVVRS